MLVLFVLFMIGLAVIEIIYMKEKIINNILPLILLIIFGISLGIYYTLHPFGPSLSFQLLKLLGVKY